MAGHVFHPGHEELHGVTVVVSDRSGKTYLGRYHEKTPRGILLHDVAVHDPDVTADGVEDWLARQRKFGVQVTQRSVVVPAETAGEVVRFNKT
jgi:hypothetical protein